ncbi:MAG: hypothetical protein ACYCQJ_16225 [Nitrososphaerales archaeon]
MPKEEGVLPELREMRAPPTILLFPGYQLRDYRRNGDAFWHCFRGSFSRKNGSNLLIGYYIHRYLGDPYSPASKLKN